MDAAKPALAVRQRVVFQAADLHVVAERIVHVQAVEPAVAHVLDAHRRSASALARVAVEVGDRVADVVDHRLAAAGRAARLPAAGACRRACGR